MLQSLFIGCYLGIAQLLSGQAVPARVDDVPERSVAFRRRFEQLLLHERRGDLAAGFGLARALGRPVAPLLWHMVDQERSNVDKRVVLLIAALIAEGPGEDQRLFSLLRQPGRMLQERCIAAMWMALGPRRTRRVDDFWSLCIGRNKEPEALLQLAVRLAAARFPDGVDSAPPVIADDFGMLAAAAFAGDRRVLAQYERWWRSTDRHVQLFRRGALLGERWRMVLEGQRPQLLDRAAELLEVVDASQVDAQDAAMLLRAAAGVLAPGSPRPEWRQLQIAASQLRSRDVLQSWLPATPLPRDDRPERIAVAYALVQPPQRIVASAGEWSRHPQIRRHLAVAFALRLCAAPPAAPLMERVAEVPEWALVRWASGGGLPEQVELDDPELQRLVALMREQRVSREVVRRTLEDTLWRWGSHPGLCALELERRLLRDLLIAGSNPGGGRYLRHVRKELRYFPTGLDRDDPFFTTALELYEFLDRPALPIPPEHRLR